jgi:hypothetical protein
MIPINLGLTYFRPQVQPIPAIEVLDKLIDCSVSLSLRHGVVMVSEAVLLPLMTAFIVAHL